MNFDLLRYNSHFRSSVFLSARCCVVVLHRLRIAIAFGNNSFGCYTFLFQIGFYGNGSVFGKFQIYFRSANVIGMSGNFNY